MEEEDTTVQWSRPNTDACARTNSLPSVKRLRLWSDKTKEAAKHQPQCPWNKVFCSSCGVEKVCSSYLAQFRCSNGACSRGVLRTGNCTCSLRGRLHSTCQRKCDVCGRTGQEGRESRIATDKRRRVFECNACFPESIQGTTPEVKESADSMSNGNKEPAKAQEAPDISATQHQAEETVSAAASSGSQAEVPVDSFTAPYVSVRRGGPP